MTTRKGNESIVQKENCFVEEIKQVELRSRRKKFMYNSVEYCSISNVNRSRVKDLSFLVVYDES